MTAQPALDLASFDVSRSRGFVPEDDPLDRLPAAIEPWDEAIADLPALIMNFQARRRIAEIPELGIDALATGGERSAETRDGDPLLADHGPCLGRADAGLHAAAQYRGAVRGGRKAARTSADRPACDAGAEQLAAPRQDQAGRARQSRYPGHLHRLASTRNGSIWRRSASSWPARRRSRRSPKPQTARRNATTARLEAMLAAARSRHPADDRGADANDASAAIPTSSITASGPIWQAGPRPASSIPAPATQPQVWSGGSAAQSSLLQSIDAALGDRARASAVTRDFLDAMLQYMPPKHRAFVAALRERSAIRDARAAGTRRRCAMLYNACIAATDELRRKHIGITSRIHHQAGPMSCRPRHDRHRRHRFRRIPARSRGSRPHVPN